MSWRRFSLQPGWVPRGETEIEKQIQRWVLRREADAGGIAVIVPHAGWAYSGKLAALGMARLQSRFSALVVVGGHLPPGARPHILAEEGILLPNGSLKNHFPLLEYIAGRMPCTDDFPGDNTVEVQLPMVRYFWGDIPIVTLRLPPDESALEMAEILIDWEIRSGESLGLIASTDLTHYGPAYGFMPQGRGGPAVEWVRRENDAKILTAMEECRSREVLRLAAACRSACSAGAAACAVEWAGKKGRTEGKLVGYHTSYDLSPGDSFVGYGAVVF